MSRNLSLYLADILTSIEKIQRYTANMTQMAFVDDERTFDAVVYNLQMIGEAVKSIPEDKRKRYPQIEWRKIAGLRDILAHTYFAIDDEIIWDIVLHKLSALYECVTKMQSDL